MPNEFKYFLDVNDDDDEEYDYSNDLDNNKKVSSNTDNANESEKNVGMTILDSSLQIARVKFIITKLIQVDHFERNKKLILGKFWIRWSKVLPLKQKCEELGRQLQERLTVVESLRDSYLRDVVSIKYHLERIQEFSKKLKEKEIDNQIPDMYDIHVIPSTSLRSLIDKAQTSKNQSSLQLQETLLQAGLINSKTGKTPNPWELSKAYRRTKQMAHGNNYKFPAVNGGIVACSAPTKHQLFVKYCQHCIGTMQFISTWNADVEIALKGKLDSISQDGIIESLKQSIQKLNNIILNQEEEVVKLQERVHQLESSGEWLATYGNVKGHKDIEIKLLEEINVMKNNLLMTVADKEAVSYEIYLRHNKVIQIFKSREENLKLLIEEQRILKEKEISARLELLQKSKDILATSAEKELTINNMQKEIESFPKIIESLTKNKIIPLKNRVEEQNIKIEKMEKLSEIETNRIFLREKEADSKLTSAMIMTEDIKIQLQSITEEVLEKEAEVDNLREEKRELISNNKQFEKQIEKLEDQLDMYKRREQERFAKDAIIEEELARLEMIKLKKPKHSLKVIAICIRFCVRFHRNIRILRGYMLIEQNKRLTTVELNPNIDNNETIVLPITDEIKSTHLIVEDESTSKVLVTDIITKETVIDLNIKGNNNETNPLFPSNKDNVNLPVVKRTLPINSNMRPDLNKPIEIKDQKLLFQKLGAFGRKQEMKVKEQERLKSLEEYKNIDEKLKACYSQIISLEEEKKEFITKLKFSRDAETESQFKNKIKMDEITYKLNSLQDSNSCLIDRISECAAYENKLNLEIADKIGLITKLTSQVHQARIMGQMQRSLVFDLSSTLISIRNIIYVTNPTIIVPIGNVELLSLEGDDFCEEVIDELKAVRLKSLQTRFFEYTQEFIKKIKEPPTVNKIIIDNKKIQILNTIQKNTIPYKLISGEGLAGLTYDEEKKEKLKLIQLNRKQLIADRKAGIVIKKIERDSIKLPNISNKDIVKNFNRDKLHLENLQISSINDVKQLDNAIFQLRELNWKKERRINDLEEQLNTLQNQLDLNVAREIQDRAEFEKEKLNLNNQKRRKSSVVDIDKPKKIKVKSDKIEVNENGDIINNNYNNDEDEEEEDEWVIMEKKIMQQNILNTNLTNKNLYLIEEINQKDKITNDLTAKLFKIEYDYKDLKNEFDELNRTSKEEYGLLQEDFNFVSNQNSTLRSNIEETYKKNMEKIESDQRKRIKQEEELKKQKRNKLLNRGVQLACSVCAIRACFGASDESCDIHNRDFTKDIEHSVVKEGIQIRLANPRGINKKEKKIDESNNININIINDNNNKSNNFTNTINSDKKGIYKLIENYKTYVMPLNDRGNERDRPVSGKNAKISVNTGDLRQRPHSAAPIRTIQFNNLSNNLSKSNLVDLQDNENNIKLLSKFSALKSFPTRGVTGEAISSVGMKIINRKAVTNVSAYLQTKIVDNAAIREKNELIKLQQLEYNSIQGSFISKDIDSQSKSPSEIMREFYIPYTKHKQNNDDNSNDDDDEEDDELLSLKKEIIIDRIEI